MKGQEEHNILFTFHFGEERFCRHDPLRVINKHYNTCKYRWSYKSKAYEEDEIHIISRTYDKVIFIR
jgi:hypothetical protein